MNKKKILIFIAMLIVSICTLSLVTYAIIASTSTRSKVTVNSETITATSTYSSSTNNYNFTFDEAGDSNTLTVITSNATNTTLHSYYDITSSSSNDLFKAILVYLNNNYIGTLDSVIASQDFIEEDFSFIPSKTNNTNSSRQDVFKFELHQSAIGSVFDGVSSVSISITTYTENADYYDYIYVKTENEFALALDDINSGLFTTTPIVVLCNNVELTSNYTIVNPTTIYLNGNNLTSATGYSLTINDTDEEDPDALLEMLGTGTVSATINLGSYYDSDAASALVVATVKDKIGEGVSTGSQTNILGYYSFYSPTITAGSICTYSNSRLVAPSSTNNYYTNVDYVTVNGTKVEFKVRGSKTELIAKTLSHLPGNGETITSDLFLPTYIPGENATITWKTSDESIILSNGKIAASKLEDASVSLYAEIKVNNTVIVEQFDFKVSAHTNEINFYKMVQEISPVVISNVYNSAEDADDALYNLPIVNANSDFDYRKSYLSPTTTQLFNWTAYKDIGLQSITYSMTQEQQTAYDYITLTNSNQLYLNATTLNNYARICITGDFGNNETYTTFVNISISVGSNTQLLEKAFAQVSEELEQISVLGNMLKTRRDAGMALEKGDFSLSSVYEQDDDYTIEYSGADTIIHSITENALTSKYDFTINPEYFNEYETTVSFTATVYYRKGQTDETSKSRTFYITVPAALHVKDFGTISIYNATKYQVYNQLPADERDETSGYTLSGTTLSDHNLDYILLRDIVGDTNYISDYANGNDAHLDYIKNENTGIADTADGVTKLNYNVSESNQSAMTDNAAYGFARLIEWATGDTRVTAASVIPLNTAAISGKTTIKSNAESYLNNDEISVLKAYYEYYTGKSFDEIKKEIISTAPGYMYTNPDLLNAVIKSLENNGITFATENFSTLFGKYMEVLQRYAVSTTTVNSNGRCIAPCQAQYNRYRPWYHSTTPNLTEFKLYTENDTEYTISVTGYIEAANGEYWYYGANNAPGYNGGDGTPGGFYANKYFESDKTSYITDQELQVVMIFWLNSCVNNLSTSLNATNSDAIDAVLAEDNNTYYSGYDINDFETIGEALINGFYACLEIPTYFTTDGIALFMKYFYNYFNRSNSKYELNSFGYTTETDNPFNSSLLYNYEFGYSIPYVTNMDNVKSVLSYFTNLTDLEIKGNSNLAAFLSENGLSTVFARVSLNNEEITKLIMNHVAHSSINFDLSNISNYENLTYLDISNNTGIQSVNELINVNRGQYTDVYMYNLGIEFEYQEFAIDNISSSTCEVFYTDASGNEASKKTSSDASSLADLSDFNKFITKYMYMTNVIRNADGTTSTVYWRIDEGNAMKATITSSGSYPTISTIEDMNSLVSPYYYCSQTFNYTYNGSTYRFIEGYVYEVSFSNGRIVRTEIGGPYSSIDDLDNRESYVDTNIPDLSDKTPTETYKSTESTINNGGTKTYTNCQYWLTNASQLPTENSTFTYAYYTYNSSSKTFSLTLPTASQIESYIKEHVINYSNVVINSYSTTVTVTSYNANDNSNNSISNAWQHGLKINGNLVYYSSNIVYGASTNTFTSFDLSSYYGNSININYYDAPTQSIFGYTYGRRLYPDYTNYQWKTYEKQCFYSISLSITYNITYGESSQIVAVRNDGTASVFSGYDACGYRVISYQGATITYTQTESTLDVEDISQGIYMYYNGASTSINDANGNTISVKNGTLIYVVPRFVYEKQSRSRTYQITGDLYAWEFFYIEKQNDYYNFNSNQLSFNFDTDLQYGNGGVIDGASIAAVIINGTNIHLASEVEQVLPGYSSSSSEYYLPPGTYTVTELSGFDVDWNDNPLTSSWIYDDCYAYPYTSYVAEMDSSSHDSLDNQVNIYDKLNNDYQYIVRYTGSSGSEDYYINSLDSTTSTFYYQNYGYKLIINSSNMLEWEFYANSITDGTGTTMASILRTANNNFNNAQYGAYYGMYYAYDGLTMYDSTLNMYLKNHYVYRIMPNATNTAFEWVEIRKYVSGNASEILLAMGTGAADIGDIYYSTGAAFGGFFTTGWHKIVVDEKTHIVNLIKFNDVTISIDNTNKRTQLTNQKIHAVSGDYLGYSGTFTIQISALIRTNNNGVYTDSVKTYKLKLVGALTS